MALYIHYIQLEIVCYVISDITKVGCPENAKSFKSQAPQGFSGCLDIENDEMNKKKIFECIP